MNKLQAMLFYVKKITFQNKEVNGKDVKVLTFFGHLFLTGSLLIVVLVSHLAIYTITELWQKDWLLCEVEKNSPFFKNQTTPEQSRLNSQFEIIQDLTNKNCKIMAFFYKQYFICLSIGGVAALVTFLCIFFLSKEGWEKSNNALVNITITAFGVTTLYLNITQVFQQEKNLKTSQDLYANYSALKNSFSSSLVLAIPTPIQQVTPLKGLEAEKKLTYADLIQDTDNKLNTLGYIRLGFDPTPITEMNNGANSIFGKNNSLNTLPQPQLPPTPKAIGTK
jgi:hypothetical protein